MSRRDGYESANTGETAAQNCCTPCCDYAEYKPREAFWDNYKALLALGVLILHFFMMGLLMSGPSLLESTLGRMCLNFVSLAHMLTMPGFSFVSGFYSKDELKNAQRVNLVRHTAAWVINHGLCFALAAPTVIKTNLELWESHHPNLNQTNALLQAEGKPRLSPPGFLPLPWFSIAGLDWYLFCVIIWRCTLPVIVQLRRPVLVSVIAGVAVMFTDASLSTYSNAPFTYLPFFMSGYYAKQSPSFIDKFRGNRAVGALLLTAAVVWHVDAAFDTELKLHAFVAKSTGCFYGGDTGAMAFIDPHEIAHNVTAFFTGDISPPQLPLTFCQSSIGVAQVLIHYAVAMVGVLALMSVTPSQPVYFMSRAGANAIYIYLGQFWFIPLFMASVAMIVLEGQFLPLGLTIPALLLVVFTVFVLLSQPCFKCCCKPCIEPGVERGCLAIATGVEVA